jgi:hypothetical protein
MRPCFLAMGILFFCLSPLCADGYDQATGISLQHLPPLVIVAECSAELTDAGVVCAAIEQDMRQALQKAGIPVLEKADHSKTPPPFLALKVSSARLVENHTVQLFAVTLRLDVIQGVQLARAPTEVVPASTWSTSRTEILGNGRLTDIRTDAAALVDEFTRRYAAAKSHA